MQDKGTTHDKAVNMLEAGYTTHSIEINILEGGYTTNCTAVIFSKQNILHIA
jgi:hypothetical protein